MWIDVVCGLLPVGQLVGHVYSQLQVTSKTGEGSVPQALPLGLVTYCMLADAFSGLKRRCRRNAIRHAGRARCMEEVVVEDKCWPALYSKTTVSQ
jgi:hypothetical protein